MKKNERGILTVESSIILTTITFLMLFLFSFARIYCAQSLVSHATLQAADAVALESYLRETALQSDVDDVVYLASNITQSSAISAESLESLRSADITKIAREKFIAAIASTEGEADEKLKNMGVKNGLSGIDFSASTMDLSKDDVIVAVSYNLEMQFDIFGADELSVTKSAKAKTFGEILFEVSTKPNVPSWGTTSGDDKVMHGTTVQIEAKPEYGYKFVMWDDGVTDNPRTVTVTDAMDFVAIFEKDKFGVNLNTTIKYNTSVAGMTHTDYGVVSGEGVYEYLDTAVIKATPKTNYKFVGWDDNGDGVADNTDKIRSITVDKTYHITAIFKPVEYTVTVKSNNSNYGTTKVTQGRQSGNKITVEYGSKVVLTAISKDSAKYGFKKWDNNSTESTTTVTVKKTITYTATFETKTYKVKFYGADGKVYHETLVIKESSVDGSKNYVDSSWPLDPKTDGAHFDCWKANDKKFTSKTTVSSNLNVYPSWYCTVTLNANGGKINKSATYSYNVDKGSSFDFDKTPTRDGYTFKGWCNEDSKYTGAKEISSDITVKAKWSCKHEDNTIIDTYQPYCSEIYSGGKLKSGATKPYREYECNTCDHTWKVTDNSLRKHHRMDYSVYDDGGRDDFWDHCNKKHTDNHYGYCGKYWSDSGSRYHTWNGYYHILCSYCQKEEQGSVWCYVDGELKYYNLHKCALHNKVGKCDCPV